MATLIFRRLKAKTEPHAIAEARQICRPCNQRSYAGVRWTDADGVETRWTWEDLGRVMSEAGAGLSRLSLNCAKS
jgi:hypothetical protein